MELRYLYVGSSDTGRDLAAWLQAPGATLRWRFRHFGADVAAVDLGVGPAVLIADHRPPGSVLTIYAVVDLSSMLATLDGHGWTKGEIVGTPEGPACVLEDASGGTIALLQVDRPLAMDSAYVDPGNQRAVRPAMGA